MNPRYRRLLIPSLLVGLVIVVVIASLVQRADAAEDAQIVSQIDDARITEASGLAVSLAHDDLVYVINDSGSAPIVYAVRLSSGQIVGTTTVQDVAWRDTEALSISADGTLWVADTGDNLRQRDEIALYALPEPGPGERVTAARRYRVVLPSGPLDIEAMAINPSDGRIYLISKGVLSGGVFALPTHLSTETDNAAEAVSSGAPGLVTDAVWSPDGARVYLRTYTSVHVYDPVDWSSVDRIDTPPQRQAESIAVESGGATLLLGTEGRPSPILRINTSLPSPTPTPVGTADAGSSQLADERPPTAAPASWWWLAGGIAGGAVIGVLLVRRSS